MNYTNYLRKAKEPSKEAYKWVSVIEKKIIKQIEKQRNV